MIVMIYFGVSKHVPKANLRDWHLSTTLTTPKGFLTCFSFVVLAPPGASSSSPCAPGALACLACRPPSSRPSLPLPLPGWGWCPSYGYDWGLGLLPKSGFLAQAFVLAK